MRTQKEKLQIQLPEDFSVVTELGQPKHEKLRFIASVERVGILADSIISLCEHFFCLGDKNPFVDNVALLDSYSFAKDCERAYQSLKTTKKEGVEA